MAKRFVLTEGQISRINKAVVDFETNLTPKDRHKRGLNVTGSIVRQFRVKSVGNDHITCRTWDGTTEGDTDVKVAKPYLLRRTPFDGETRDGITCTYSSACERQASDGVDTEDQVIVDSYIADDIIYAIRVIVGGTDTTVSDEDIMWLDLNVDGRYWAKVYAE